ncbi:MAG: hypothetical protein AAFV09_18100, partial [Pseudomonadota bacterium]
QHRSAPQRPRIPTAGARGHHPRRPEAGHALTIRTDHSVGAGQDWIPDVTQTALAGMSDLGDLLFPDGGILKAMSEAGVPTPAPHQFIAALVDKLLENGYSETDCGKVLGGNLYRVFDEVWT